MEAIREKKLKKQKKKKKSKLSSHAQKKSALHRTLL